jgi:hypothetical protein
MFDIPLDLYALRRCHQQSARLTSTQDIRVDRIGDRMQVLTSVSVVSDAQKAKADGISQELTKAFCRGEGKQIIESDAAF